MSVAVTEPARLTWQDRLFLAMVAVLPLHTVFLSAWISWKPYMVALVGLVVADGAEGIRERRWPYRVPVTWALVVFGVVLLIGFPSPQYRERFFRLGLAIVVGALVMVVTDRRLRRPGMVDRTLRVVFWTGAAMSVTAVLFSLVAVGTFGGDTINAVNDLPGVFRTSKPAYLKSGFLALTNWHQDPGYGAAWGVLWAMLALVASVRGLGTRRWWLGGVVIGGLGFAVIMAFSRTGWLALPLASAIVTVALVRSGVHWREPLRRVAVAVASALVLLSGVWALDAKEVGGDLDLQFAFRFSQGWDLLADLTGLFSKSESFADRFEPSEERADVWPEYLEMFRENPVTGVGLSVGWQTNSIRQEPHNLVIELLAETGIVGLLAFGLLLWAIVRNGGGGVAGAVLLVTFLPSMTQTVLFEPTWWFTAGLYLAGARLVREGPRNKTQPISS